MTTGQAVTPLQGSTAGEQPTLSAAFGDIVRARRHDVAISDPEHGRQLTWEAYADLVARAAGGLRRLGLRRGDVLVLMLTNRAEFHVIDAAAMHLGVTTCSLYNTSAPGQIAYVLGDVNPRLIVAERRFAAQLEAAAPGEMPVLLVDDARPGRTTWDDLVCAEAPTDLGALGSEVEPEDVVCVIYTSGTSGDPKGVELTHNAAMRAAEAFSAGMGFSGHGRVVSYLPMAHVAERACSHYLPMLTGSEVICCPDAQRIIEFLQMHRPSWFFSVPRIWEKLKIGIEAAVAAHPDLEVRTQTERALAAGIRRVRLEQRGETLSGDERAAHRHHEETTYARLRTLLGLDAARCVLVGAAPTPLSTLEFFHAIGVPLLEVWGMSELCAVSTLNPPQAPRLGSVGRPLPGVELRTAPDGELQVRTAAMMVGYRHAPELTAATIDGAGWLSTGDLATIDDDGYVHIVGRKKEIIITAGGKNVAPQYVEAKVRASSALIAHVCAVGDNRPYVTALLVADTNATATQAATQNGGAVTLIAELRAAVRAANAGLAQPEQVKRFVLLPGTWEPGGDELTPTMKLRRAAIHQKYAAQIDALYGAPSDDVTDVP